MPLVHLDSRIFDAVENMLTLPQVDLDYADALRTIIDGYTDQDPTVLQLSSSLIRINQSMWEWTGSTWITADYEFRLSGSGIGPVSTIDALITAIDQGLATGTLSNLQILREGTKVVDLAMSAAGYVFTTGSLAVTLNGHLPLTFGQLTEFVDLFTSAANIDLLTDAERTTLFADLANYGVSTLKVADSGTTLFSFNVTATHAAMTLNGLTFSAVGTFPDNFGEDLNLLWQVFQQFDLTGTLDFATLTNLSVSSIAIKDAAGTVLATVANPLDGSGLTWQINASSFDEVLMGSMGRDVFFGTAGVISSALAGLGGNDDLRGRDGSDFLYGGSGQDKLFGGAGSDRLIGGAGQDQLFGGIGSDRLIGGINIDVLTGGFGKDTFVFDPLGGLDQITDFKANVDIIEILAANQLSDLIFTDNGTGVRIDFNTVHIQVLNIEIAALNHAENFHF